MQIRFLKTAILAILIQVPSVGIFLLLVYFLLQIYFENESEPWSEKT